MCLAGACGVWDAGLGRTIDPDPVLVCGARQIDPGEKTLLEEAGVTMVGGQRGAIAQVRLALGGSPVFIHLDVDVLDPDEMPAQFPAPGGFSPQALRDLLEMVLEDCELVGAEVTALEERRLTRRSLWRSWNRFSRRHMSATEEAGRRGGRHARRPPVASLAGRGPRGARARRRSSAAARRRSPSSTSAQADRPRAARAPSTTARSSRSASTADADLAAGEGATRSRRPTASSRASARSTAAWSPSPPTTSRSRAAPWARPARRRSPACARSR